MALDQKKTTFAVLALVGFSLISCCGLTLLVGGYARWDELKNTPPDELSSLPGGLEPDMSGEGEAGEGEAGEAEGTDEPPSASDERHDDRVLLVYQLMEGLGCDDFLYEPTTDRFEQGEVALDLSELSAAVDSAEPSERLQVMRDAVLEVCPSPIVESWAKANKHLFVALHQRAMLESQKLLWPERKAFSRPAGDELVEAIVFVGQDRAALVGVADAARWKKSESQLWDEARRNSAALKVPTVTTRPDGVIELQDLMPHQVTRLATERTPWKVKGEPIYMFAQHQFFVVGADDAEAQQGFVDGNEAMNVDSRAFRRVGDQFEGYTPPSDSPLLSYTLRALDWRSESQTRALRAAFEEQGSEVIVGALARDDDESPSSTTWVMGTTSLLPSADVLTVVDQSAGAVVATVPFDAALKLLKKNVQRDDAFWPVRYRFSGTLDRRTLKALERKAPPATPAEP